MEETLDEDRYHDISIETNDDIYSNKRNEKYGECTTCNRYNTNNGWCQSCDPELLVHGWTSGNETIDEIIKSTQLNAKGYDSFYYLQWIDFDDLNDIEKIGEGGFATIYKATWIKGDRYVDYLNKRRIGIKTVALKKLKSTQNIFDRILNELKNYIKFYKNARIINIYGVTKDPITKEYMLLMEYIKDGSLQNYLSKDFKNLKWKDKTSILYDIICGLKRIHKQNVIHRDLHSGNILQQKDVYSTFSYISDFGLSISIDQTPSPSNRRDVFGVLPYLAPEILRSEPHTTASDIYSFGVLMSVISTGRPPISNLGHDTDLAITICQGLRPAFSINTPKFYIRLAYQCMDTDPDKRPNAEEIRKVIKFWEDSFDDRFFNENSKKYSYSDEKTAELGLVRNEFLEMDKTPFDPSTITTAIHPDAVYTSRLLNFANLPQPVNSSEVTIIGNYNDSHQVDLSIPDEFSDKNELSDKDSE